MDKLPSLNKKIVKVTSLEDIEEEKKYWFSKSPLERIEAIEINRRMIYGQDRIPSRLQRFFARWGSGHANYLELLKKDCKSTFI